MENLLIKTRGSWLDTFLGKVVIIYLDTESNFLDQEFQNYELLAEYTHKQDARYTLRAILIKRKLVDEFKKASKLIFNKSAICNYTKFEEYYKETFELFNDINTKIKVKRH